MNLTKRKGGNVFIIICLLILTFSCKEGKKSPAHSEQYIQSLFQKGEDSISSNPKLAQSLFRQVMSLTKDSNKYYNAYLLYSKVLFNNSQFDSAVFIQRKTLEYCNRTPNVKGISDLKADAYNAYSAYWGRIGQLDSAIYYGKEALKFIVDRTTEPDIDINLSDNYSFKGDYAQAALYLHSALHVTDKYNLEQMRFPIYFALGCLYNNMKEYKDADFYFKRAEKDYESRKDNEKEVYCNNRGNYYYFTGQYKAAEHWFKKGIVFAIKMKDVFMESFYYVNLSDTYLKQKNYTLCQVYADKAVTYFKSIKFDRGLYYVTTIRIGLAVEQGDYAHAHRLQADGSSKTEDANLVSIRNKYMEALALKENNYKEAYHYLKQENKLNDSLRNDLTHKKIAEISLRYQQDTTLIKKEMLILSQKAEMKTLRLGYYIWFLLFILVVASSVWLYYYLKRRHLLQREKYIRQVVQYRMSNIRNRISPHLLFNVLNQEMDSFDEERKKHFYALVNLLRKSLDMSEKVSVSLQEEMDFAKRFVELENYRGKGTYHIKWSVDPNINLQTTLIVPMMIQIPIENSIKHGFAQVADREKWIEVTLNKKPEGVYISIVDNGTGYHPECTKVSNKSNTGTGLKVIRQTIQILNEQNTEQISFHIENIDQEDRTGTLTKLFIPANFKFILK